MTSDEFAKNFYLEKLNILKSCFEEQPQYPSAVNAKIKEMVLSNTQQEQLKDVIDTLLTDVFYSLLLGLDGESSIGNTQQTYKIYDEEGNLISITFLLRRAATKAASFRTFSRSAPTNPGVCSVDRKSVVRERV